MDIDTQRADHCNAPVAKFYRQFASHELRTTGSGQTTRYSSLNPQRLARAAA